ncbi:M43 family zinc metalloprotease [Spirosoma pulveris]
MKKILYVFLWMALGSCTRKTETAPQPKPAPIASFTFAEGEYYAPAALTFTNISQNATAYAWDFGDGTTPVTEASPKHIFHQKGTFTVTLTATGPGGSQKMTKSLTVKENPDYRLELKLKDGLAGGMLGMLANGKSALAFDVTLYDKAGTPIPAASAIKLYDNGSELTSAVFKTTGEGPHEIQAKGYGISSNTLVVNARKDAVFETVRIPLVFHLMYKNDTWTTADLQQMIDYVNKLYAGALYDDTSPKRDPNTVNTYIEFYLADTDPTGRTLPKKGLNKVSDDPTLYDTGSDPLVVKNALAASWNPTRYLNVFLYNSKYPNAANGIYPTLPADKPLKGIGTATASSAKTTYGVYWPGDFRIDPVNYFPAFAHELGHCLSLIHVFQEGNCNQDLDYCADTPVFLFEEVNKGIVRTACSGVRFLGTNIMDYGVPSSGCFTFDQRTRMRHTLDWAYNLPTKINQTRK